MDMVDNVAITERTINHHRLLTRWCYVAMMHVVFKCKEYVILQTVDILCTSCVNDSPRTTIYRQVWINMVSIYNHGSFTFYVDVFFPLSLPRHLPDLTVYMSNTLGVL